MSDDDLKDIKQGVEIISEVIKAAGDNEKVKAAGSELGDSALTITKAVNNALLPLAAVNFAFEKARNYFQNKFESDITEKTQNIPQGDLMEPKASIAGPALQGLAFSHDEDSLKEMYLNLLSTSMNKNVSKYAHPAYVEIIRQLDSEEAKIIKDILSSDTNQLPIAQLRNVQSARSYTTVQTYVLNVIDDETNEPTNMPEIVNMVDNFIRLGLITVDFNLTVGQPKAYDWVDNRPEIELVKKLNEDKNMNIEGKKGLLTITNFGTDFAKAVGIKNT